jgi:hypothetical protein
MVIDSPTRIYKGGCSWKTLQGFPRGVEDGLLSSPSLRLSEILWFRQNGLPICASDPVQNLIHSFLNAGVRPVKLSGGLGGKLTEHITIPQSM